MDSKLQNLYDELEHQRAEILSQVSVLSATQFNQQPKQGTWSIGQIITHLVTSEQLSVRYMEKKSLGIGQLPNSGLLEALRLSLLKATQRVPIKYKAPRVIVERTPQGLTKDEILISWKDTREQLRELLEGIQKSDVKRLIYKHPLAGRLDVRQAMIFLKEHTAHHLPQIKRLL